MESEIESYGLRKHLDELDETGICVIPPSETQVRRGLVERAHAALLDVAERRTGLRFEIASSPKRAIASRLMRAMDLTAFPAGQVVVSHLLYEGAVFEEIYVNAVRKTVMRHLLGDVHRMSTSNGWITFRTPASFDKGMTRPLQADTIGPPPWPRHAPHVANMHWLLTDYTRENEALVYVPGSHRQGSQPQNPQTLMAAVALEAPAGSMVFVHGATWYGACRKETEGLSLSIDGLCCRPYYMPQQDYRGRVAREVFGRSPDPAYLRVQVREGDPWLEAVPGCLAEVPGQGREDLSPADS